MHRRTILASESTLMIYPRRPYRAACTSSCRRDEEIGADSNYIVRLQPASEQGINATSGQSWITISPHLCQCIIFIIMCKCPICSQSPYSGYRDQSEANSGKPSRDSLRDSCPRDAEAEDTRSLSSRNLQSPTKEIICQSVAYAHSGPESEEIVTASGSVSLSPEVRNSNTTTSRCTRYYTKRSHPSLR